MRLKETKDAELVRSSVPIAGENDGYVDAQPEIEDCSNGFAPQPNTTADGSQKMIVPVVLSMTSYLFSHYKDMTSMNGCMSGDFPTLLPGQNAISWTGNVTKIVVQPNWRYLA